MNHHDLHDLPDSSGNVPGDHDATADRLRSGLDAAGRRVHAPAGMVAAALRGGRRRRRQRRAAIGAPIALVAVGALGLSWAQPWSGQVRTVPVAG